MNPVPPTSAMDVPVEEALTPFTRKWSRRLLYLSVLNFIIAGTLALFMRTDQAGSSNLIGPLGAPQVFGQLLLAHGLGMFVGWQFPFTYGLIAYALPKYMKRRLFSESLLPVVFFLFMIGFYLVWLSAATGFGPGWYFLFPLPFHGGPPGLSPWGPTQALMFFFGMIITNVSLFVFSYMVFGTAFSSKYRDDYNTKPGYNHSMSAKFAAAIGFDAYMPKAVRSRILGYPPAAIAAIVTTVDMIVSAPPFLTLLGDGAWTSMNNPSFLNNLVAKNFLWINYHPIVYYAFFPLIGMYYTLIPILARRNFSSSRWAKAPWPLLLITGVGVYSHHLFIDTAQPYILQFMSQQMSMIIGIASGISVFTLLALVWRSKYEWNLTAKWLAASIFGWIIGGIGGVEQGNTALDVYLHNTYAVVGHFHFNGLDGIVFAGFGVLYWILPEISNKAWYSKTLGEIHLWGSLVGGFGLAFTFTAMGYLGVPRRQYLPVNAGLPFTITLDYQTYLVIAFFFAIVVAAAQIPFIWNLLKTLTGPTMTKPVITPSSLEESLMIPAPVPIARAADSADSSPAELGGAIGGSSPSGIGLGSSMNPLPKRKEDA